MTYFHHKNRGMTYFHHRNWGMTYLQSRRIGAWPTSITQNGGMTYSITANRGMTYSITANRGTTYLHHSEQGHDLPPSQWIGAWPTSITQNRTLHQCLWQQWKVVLERERYAGGVQQHHHLQTVPHERPTSVCSSRNVRERIQSCGNIMQHQETAQNFTP